MNLRRGRAALLTVAATVAAITTSGGAAQAAASGAAAVRAAAAAQSLTWSVVPSPNPGSRYGPDTLSGLSCLSASDCVAVGQRTSVTNSGEPQTLIESWNGTTWSVVPSPSPGTTPAGSALYGVSCVSARDCTAVGSRDIKTLVETWNGSKWSVVPSPSRIYHNYLRSVSCVSASSCVAVGYGDGSALAESWNGSKWSIVTTPDPAPAGYSDNLSGASCVSASRCTAVGYYINNGQGKTVVESWNGSKWSVVPSPNPGTGDINELTSVSCVSASRCMAVGSHEVPDYYDQTLAESWNGSKWSAVPIPDAATVGNNELSGVSCVSASDCTTVGWYTTSNYVSRTLIESWNGTAWSVVPSPNAGSTSQSNQLYGVSCVSTANCAADGWRDNSNGIARTLTERGTSA